MIARVAELADALDLGHEKDEFCKWASALDIDLMI